MQQRSSRSTRLGLGALMAAGALVMAACSSSSAGDPTGPAGTTGGSTPSGGSAASSSAPKTSAPPKPVAAISIGPAKQPINPTTPINVTVAKGTLQSVKVSRPGVAVSGAFNPARTSWSSNEDLGYGRTYTVTATAKGTDGKTVHKQGKVRVIKPKHTAYPSVIPPPAHPDVGVGQPLVVRWGTPIANRVAAEKTLQVTATPPQPGAWYWISDSEVHYRPKTYWKPHTRITLTIKDYGVDFGNDTFGEEDRVLHDTIHDSWVAKANAATEQMQVFHNGAMVKQIPVSMGKQATPTHEGIHVISQKSQEYTMNSCSYGVCSGPHAYISKEYWAERISNDGEFVHENPLSVASQGHENVSHGCINLNEANAKWFFAHFGLGDVVEVYNSNGGPLPLGDTYGDWSVPWSTWSAGNANQ